jgi:hypothetical protein
MQTLQAARFCITYAGFLPKEGKLRNVKVTSMAGIEEE